MGLSRRPISRSDTARCAIGFDDLKWLVPVRPGDVLSVENVVVEKVESRSRREIGVVRSRVAS